MRKKLFFKYFFIFSSIFLIGVVASSALLYGMLAQYYQGVAFASLQNDVAAANFILANSANNENASFEWDYGKGTMPTANALELLAGLGENGFILADAQGQILYTTTSGCPLSPNAAQIPDSILQSVKNKNTYQELGSFSDLFSENYCSVGAPLETKDQTAGYVFAFSSTAKAHQFRTHVLELLICASVVILAIGFFIVFLLTKRITRPLQELSNLTHSYGQGDFSSTVAIKSNDEIGQLADSIQLMGRNLATLEASRQSFVANVSHELKTPMTSISGFVDGILDGTIPKKDQSKYLQIISSEVKRLSRLVINMLNLSKIESGEMALQLGSFDLCHTILQILLSFESSIEEQQISIDGLEVPGVWVMGDEDLIWQVLYNLMDNAIKFTDPGGKITFSFTATPHGRTTIAIGNTGKGLTSEECNQVFDRFYKGDPSRGLEKNSAGLGLNIAKSIVLLHGGNLTVKSTPGKETVFSFDLENCTSLLPWH